ncbi:hypothetical protein [Pararhodonellum marinum]|uniref:hypothetical protein n=1 Tax=Pararhodonellum marinum TaxID=2755358 RepID=UPI00188F6923|nr:hypothetical protein [Pararhodonellum marinum]
MKKIICLAGLFLGLAWNVAMAQDKVEILEASLDYALAQLNEDYEMLLDFTYPGIISSVGGRNAMEKTLIQVNQTQKTKGKFLIDYRVKEATVTKLVGEEFHALIPITTVTQVPGGKITTESVLIGVLSIPDHRWYFIETATLTERNIPKVLPQWDFTLNLPLKKAPVFKEER